MPVVVDAAVLDAVVLRRWVQLCAQVLAAHRASIDALNVFPVADRDTGTNLLATVAAAQLAVEGAGEAEVLTALASGARDGARGNSGLILAEVFAGFAVSGPLLDAAGVVRALALAATRARAAVADPAPGTVLTVLDVVAAATASAGDDLTVVLSVAGAAAGAAVAATTTQLPELARAGVVDAGGRGLELVLRALECALTGAALPGVSPPTGAPPGNTPPPGGAVAAALGDGSSGYEVVFRLTGSDAERVARLRARLAEIGTSVVVGGDPGATTTVHVHTADAGAALEAGVQAGRPHHIEVEVLAAESRREVLALVRDPGLAALFSGAGAVVHVVGRAEPAGVLAQLRTGAAEVTVLGNGAVPDPVLTEAVRTAREAGRRLTLVPTAGAVQGLAALAVHDPGRDGADDVVAMTEAAAATRCATVRVAEVQGLTWVGHCEPGDVLALLDGDVALIESDQVAAATRLVDRMLGAGGELLTLLTGVEAVEGLVDALATHVATVHRGVELVVFPVGLAGVALELGVE